MLTIGADGSARLWEVNTGREQHVLQTTPGAFVMAATYSPDGSRIVTIEKSYKKPEDAPNMPGSYRLRVDVYDRATANAR